MKIINFSSANISDSIFIENFSQAQSTSPFTVTGNVRTRAEEEREIKLLEQFSALPEDYHKSITQYLYLN